MSTLPTCAGLQPFVQQHLIRSKRWMMGRTCRENSLLSKCQAMATVVQNRACSLDESVRLVTLSIPEDVEFIEGLRMPRKPAQPRWVDSFQAPGQVVDITFGEGPPFCVAVASSPYATKAASANIDATLIEIVAATGGKAACLMAAAPGDQVAVGAVRGSGFAGVISPDVTLASALEEKRPVVMLVCGADGMAPIRSALEWAPLQAHASEAPVVLCYVADSMAGAAFLADWDAWREMGITVIPLYMHSQTQASEGSNGAGSPELQFRPTEGSAPAPDALSQDDRMILLFQEALFSPAKRWQELMKGKAKDAIVLVSGIPGPVSSALIRVLSTHKVQRERMLRN